MDSQVSLAANYLGNGVFNRAGAAGAAGAAGGGAGGGAGANHAIFSQNAKVGSIIKADEDAALAAARVAQSQANTDNIVDSQVQDRNEGEVREVEVVAAEVVAQLWLVY